MESDWTSLLPPLVAIAVAIAMRQVVIPLSLGVATGALLLALRSSDSPLVDAPVIFGAALRASIWDSSHLQAFAFSLLLGAMVGVLEISGSIQSLIRMAARTIRSRSGAQTLITTSGLLIFFDDYANTLLLGGTMRSTADRYKISRAKLAYLVDSTAAPVAGLAIVSTWAATEITYMANGLTASGITEPSAAFELFIQSIPYRFYPWFALAFTFLVATSGRDFGPMASSEQAATQAPELSDTSDDTSSPPKLWIAAVTPIVICLTTVTWVLIKTGIDATADSPPSPNWIRRAGQIFGNGDSYLALVLGGVVGLITAWLIHIVLGKRDLLMLLRGTIRGAKQMLPAMLVLWLAWSLSEVTKPEALDTGGYLSRILSSRLSPEWLPTAVFLLAGGIAFSTGTSWGTMALVTPVAIELALRLDPSGNPHNPICVATTGAVLAGAIFGDHCSPISDTTVLSSRASGCDHMEHVRTQMPYALTVAFVSVLFGTIPSAWGFSSWLSLLAGVIALALIIRLFGRKVSPPEMDTQPPDPTNDPIENVVDDAPANAKNPYAV